MSSLVCRKQLRDIFCLTILLCTALNCFAGGLSEQRNEAKKHITLQGKSANLLSLDDVLLNNKSIYVDSQSSQKDQKLEPILIRVTGYSAYGSKDDAVSEPKRLEAMRASKIDAYRALAERVYGISIKGTSKVQGFVMKEDQLAIGFDSYIRGARVVSINENKGIGFETVLELMLPGNFDDCLNKVNQFKHGYNCLRPLPDTSFYLEEGGSETGKSGVKTSSGYQGSTYFLK